MNITQYLNYLPTLLKARVTPCVWGIHGIGKTAVPVQFAEKHGHRLFNLRLGNLADQGDIIGLLNIVDGASTFMPPKWLKELIDFAVENPDKYAIIHLDEVNRVRKDMLNIVFQIALENRIHEQELPDNVRVIASANPPVEGYWVNDFTENALMDRFCHLLLNPTTEEWLSNARAKNIEGTVADFISGTPSALHSKQLVWSPDEYCKPSNRSWEAVARLVVAGAPRELVYGCVGSAQGAAYYSWLDSNQVKAVTGKEVINGYKPAARKRVLKLVELGRISELSDTINQIVELATGEVKTEADEMSLDEGAAVARFLDDVPVDLGYRAWTQLCLLNKINTVLFPISESDKRPMPDQWKHYNRIKDMVMADPKAFEQIDAEVGKEKEQKVG